MSIVLNNTYSKEKFLSIYSELNENKWIFMGEHDLVERKAHLCSLKVASTISGSGCTPGQGIGRGRP